MEKQQQSGWKRGKCIGKGSFGSVSVAVRNSSSDGGGGGGVFAVKSVCRELALSNQIESLENEIRILRSISGLCPYIVDYLGDDVSFESSTSFRNLHLEYLPRGTVADVAVVADERVLRWRIRCIVSALKFVHGKGFVHCDVKGKNILVGPTASVKLTDFGSAVKIQKNRVSGGSPLQPRGSPLWMAPEVVRGEYQGPESDIWSLGCTI